MEMLDYHDEFLMSSCFSCYNWHLSPTLLMIVILSPPSQVFDSGGELNDSPPTMFHPKHSAPQVQQQLQTSARVAAAHDFDASAPPALPPPATAQAAPSSPPAPSVHESPLPVPVTSLPNNQPPHHASPLQQQHRVTQMQLVRSSGNITVTSAAPAVSSNSSSSSRIESVHLGPNISTVPSPAPDAAAALAEQLMAKMQVRTRSLRGCLF